ncbi:conserved hypothetical protein [Perkinsus marinus ATCC 50983]|uniref:J domain-containing protein n=1 Tax=Perkinsus marinus (strain ATCC 50983 / TXsc) TaxID=423536 RepID=C5M052_PERM5|nr:conserved hypothetical protein [Perkinsus marinus ATCC 50983]EEQ97630.1 conserved hypothetical protein [Perkinsus marinus ATCC 50983]|eukprot:XP_002764913.1 conserved hypothetical protein [Perkinsus marinus ATCC 50983]
MPPGEASPPGAPPNHYRVLGLTSERATADEIRKSYRRLLLKHHPDKGGTVDGFHTIQEAYDTLINPCKRRRYDQVDLPRAVPRMQESVKEPASSNAQSTLNIPSDLTLAALTTPTLRQIATRVGVKLDHCVSKDELISAIKKTGYNQTHVRCHQQDESPANGGSGGNPDEQSVAPPTPATASSKPSVNPLAQDIVTEATKMALDPTDVQYLEACMESLNRQMALEAWLDIGRASTPVLDVIGSEIKHVQVLLNGITRTLNGATTRIQRVQVEATTKARTAQHTAGLLRSDPSLNELFDSIKRKGATVAKAVKAITSLGKMVDALSHGLTGVARDISVVEMDSVGVEKRVVSASKKCHSEAVAAALKFKCSNGKDLSLEQVLEAVRFAWEKTTKERHQRPQQGQSVPAETTAKGSSTRSDLAQNTTDSGRPEASGDEETRVGGGEAVTGATGEKGSSVAADGEGVVDAGVGQMESSKRVVNSEVEDTSQRGDGKHEASCPSVLAQGSTTGGDSKDSGDAGISGNVGLPSGATEMEGRSTTVEEAGDGLDLPGRQSNREESALHSNPGKDGGPSRVVEAKSTVEGTTGARGRGRGEQWIGQDTIVKESDKEVGKRDNGSTTTAVGHKGSNVEPFRGRKKRRKQHHSNSVKATRSCSSADEHEEKVRPTRKRKRTADLNRDVPSTTPSHSSSSEFPMMKVRIPDGWKKGQKVRFALPDGVVLFVPPEQCRPRQILMYNKVTGKMTFTEEQQPPPPPQDEIDVISLSD